MGIKKTGSTAGRGVGRPQRRRNRKTGEISVFYQGALTGLLLTGIKAAGSSHNDNMFLFPSLF